MAVIGMAGNSAAALADADMFDASFFGFTPEDAHILDPQQRLFLEHSWHALEDAGHDPRRFAGLIGVFACSDALAARVGHILGPRCSVQNRAPESLAAVCAGATSLARGECDMALVGEIATEGPDAAAIAIVVVRRLADALADGDQIRAVLRVGVGAEPGGPPKLADLARLIKTITSLKRTAIPPVASFEVDGSHVVLERAARPATRPVPLRTRHLLVLSARTRTALTQLTSSLRSSLAADSNDDLGDYAFTLQTGRASLEHRMCVVSTSRHEAATALASPDCDVLTAVQHATDRPVGLLIAGVGEQYRGLAGSLYATEPAFHDRLDAGRAALWSQTGRDPLAEFIGERSRPDADDSSGFRALVGRAQRDEDTTTTAVLSRPEVIQPVLFTIWYALAETLRDWGVRPAMMLGYSLGEYVAACLSGVLSFDDALRLVTCRANLISRMPPGAMVAVALSEVATQAVIAQSGLPIDIAGANAPLITVVAGAADAVESFRNVLSARSVACRTLETSHGYHSRLLSGAADDLTAWISRCVSLNEPSIPYLSNITGRVVSAREATDPGYWARHMCATVRFGDAVTTMLAREDLVLLEIGPGPSLGTMVRANPRCGRNRWGSIIATLPSAADPRSADAVMAEAIGRLWLAGVAVDFDTYQRGHRGRRISLPRYPFRPGVRS
jgi:acyl transferase domain-containing protein